jgi:hypothetical protein
VWVLPLLTTDFPPGETGGTGDTGYTGPTGDTGGGPAGITVTDRGRFYVSENPSSSADTTATSSSFTPTQGNVLVLTANCVIPAGAGLTLTPSTTLSNVTFSLVDSGYVASQADVATRTSIWVAAVGASPGTGTVTVTRSGGTVMQWLDCALLEVAGVSATVTNKANAANTDVGDFTVSLPNPPSASSMLVGAGLFVNDPTVGMPGGVTTHHNAGSVHAGTAFYDKDGSLAQASIWTGAGGTGGTGAGALTAVYRGGFHTVQGSSATDYVQSDSFTPAPNSTLVVVAGGYAEGVELELTPSTTIGGISSPFASVVKRGGTPVGTPGENRVFIGMSWTNSRPSPGVGDTYFAANIMQSEHIMEAGAGWPWPVDLTPVWSELDYAMQDVRDGGAIEKLIVGNKAPCWMVGNPTGCANGTADDQRPTNANFPNFANVCGQAAARYNDFQWLVAWNEYKGFWDNANNRPDWVNYQQMYDLIYTNCKAVRGDIKVGGPYTTQIGCTENRGEMNQDLTFSGGWYDNRWMQAMEFFINNADYDFLAFDMGIEQQAAVYGQGTYFKTSDPQIDKFANFIEWIRSHGGNAATCPIICVETYVHALGWAPGGAWGGGLGYSESEMEDAFIDMARLCRAASPNGDVYLLTWQHPEIWPQTLAHSGGNWVNSASGFYSKVNAFHAE